MIRRRFYSNWNHCKPGAFKPHIDSMLLENQLIVSFLDYPGQVWRSGKQGCIEVKEAVHPLVIDKIPRAISWQQGRHHRKNDSVGRPAGSSRADCQKGQLLVSGVIESDTIGVRYVHSMGQVLARTWYQKQYICLLRSHIAKDRQEIRNQISGMEKV